MNVLLAEDIGGWLAAGMLFLGGLASSLLALAALFPAWRGNRPFTIGMIIPAILMFILTTAYLAQTYTARAFHDQEEIMENYVQPFFLMALPPLLAAIPACCVLWYKRRKRT